MAFCAARLLDRLIGLLLRNRIRLEQISASGRRWSAPAPVGLGGLQIGPRLLQLLIDLGRVDLRQQFALSHTRADIEIPVLQIAVGTGIDRRIDEGLGVAGQHDLLRRRRGCADGPR